MLELDRIDGLAKEKGIKLSFICKQINRSESYFRQIRAGRSNITEDVLCQIAEVLNTTPEYLHGKTDVKEKATPVSEGGLTDEELAWLSIFRSLTQQEKERYFALFAALKGLGQ
ncbi:MAG: helix-turn-helix transcriptional regulator [Clostridia bacterium]|nr:helix-turn-helix transcriptional regulator [Clostridia bacterium]